MEEEKKAELGDPLDSGKCCILFGLQDMDWRSAIEHDYREMLKAHSRRPPLQAVASARLSAHSRIRYENASCDGKKQSARQLNRRVSRLPGSSGSFSTLSSRSPCRLRCTGFPTSRSPPTSPSTAQRILCQGSRNLTLH